MVGSGKGKNRAGKGIENIDKGSGMGGVDTSARASRRCERELCAQWRKSRPGDSQCKGPEVGGAQRIPGTARRLAWLKSRRGGNRP